MFLYEGDYKRSLLMSYSLILQQCSGCLVCLTWMICEIGDKWPYSFCFVVSYLKDLFKTAHSILAFSPSTSLKPRWCNHTIKLTWLQLERIPLLFHQRLDFYIVDNQSITVHAFPLGRSKLYMRKNCRWTQSQSPLYLKSILQIEHQVSWNQTQSQCPIMNYTYTVNWIPTLWSTHSIPLLKLFFFSKIKISQRNEKNFQS